MPKTNDPIIPRPHWRKVVVKVSQPGAAPFLIEAGTLWDRIHNLPAVQVVVTRVAQGEVSQYAIPSSDGDIVISGC